MVRMTKVTEDMQMNGLVKCLKINGKKVGVEKAAHWACDYLAKHHEKAGMQALLKRKWPIVQYMNEEKLDKMSQEAKLTHLKQEIVMKHMRTHFGKRAFASRRKQRELRRTRNAESTDGLNEINQTNKEVNDDTEQLEDMAYNITSPEPIYEEHE